jgi:hypothetical protein
MAILGGAVTNKFVIGNFELRVGPQNMAGKLTSAHSVGVIDRFAVRSQQQSADLMGLFPQELIDTDVVSQTTQLTATLREFSPRNMNILLGNGLVKDNDIVEGNTMSQLSSQLTGTPEVKPSITVQNLALTSGGSVADSKLNRKVWVINNTGTFTQVNSGVTYDSTTGKITFYSATSTPWGTSSLDYYMISAYGAADKPYTAYLPLFVGKIVSATPTAAYTGKITTAGTGTAAVTTLEVYASNATKADAAVTDLADKYVEFCTASGTGSGTTVTLVADRFTKITAAVADGSLVRITLGKAPPSGATHYRLRNAASGTTTNFFGAVTSSVAYVAPVITAAGNTVQLSSEFSGVMGAYNNMKLTIDGLLFVITAYTVTGGIRTATVKYVGPNAATNWPSTGTTPKVIHSGTGVKITTVTEAYSGVFANDAGASSVSSAPITAVDATLKTVTFAHTDYTDFTGYTATIRTTGGLTYHETISESSFDDGKVTVSFDSDSSTFVSLFEKDDTITLNATNYKKGVTLLFAADAAKYTNTTILKGTRLLLWDKSNHDEVQLVTVAADSLPADGTSASDKYRTIHFSPGLAFDAHVGYHGDYGIALVDPVSMGNQAGVNYLSASLIMKDRAIEAPIVFDFWKVAVSSGLNLSLNATDFSSVDLVLDVLEPTESDKTNIYPALASTISKHPLYRYSSTPDA